MQVATYCSKRDFSIMKPTIIFEFCGFGVKLWHNNPTTMELHPQPQMSLWFCFLSLFEANGVTVMTSPLSVKMGRISSILLLSFLSQWCEADGRTLHLGLPGKSWSCHHFLSAGLIQLPIFLRGEGLRWQFNYSETSNLQASLSLNMALCIFCYSHSFAINIPLSGVFKMSIYVKDRRFIAAHTRGFYGANTITVLVDAIWSVGFHRGPCGK